MGKAKGPKSGTLPQRELFERMNFLYQSARLFASLGGAGSSDHGTTEAPATGKDSTSTSKPARPLQPLSRFYTKEMRAVARKSVLRLSPHMKRELCRVCSSPLLPGISCTTRARKRKGSARVVTTCTYCGGQTKLLTNPGHLLFVDRDEHGTLS